MSRAAPPGPGPGWHRPIEARVAGPGPAPTPWPPLRTLRAVAWHGLSSGVQRLTYWARRPTSRTLPPTYGRYRPPGVDLVAWWYEVSGFPHQDLPAPDRYGRFAKMSARMRDAVPT